MAGRASQGTYMAPEKQDWAVPGPSLLAWPRIITPPTPTPPHGHASWTQNKMTILFTQLAYTYRLYIIFSIPLHQRKSPVTNFYRLYSLVSQNNLTFQKKDDGNVITHFMTYLLCLLCLASWCSCFS
jgi:hypothetical protein